MNEACNHFLQELIVISPGLRKAYEESLAYWLPDLPPITTLFAVLGRQIGREFADLSAEAKSRVFQLVEDGMTSSDDLLKTAVATGLIEALVSSSVPSGPWESIAALLGNQSLKHARAWGG